LFAASIIALTSSIEELGDIGTFGPAEWVLLVTAVSSFLSLMALMGYHFCKRQFVGTIWGEGIAAYLLLLFWIGGISVVLAPHQGLAVTSTAAGLNVVINANLYFSCWISFFCIAYICASWTMNHWKKAEKIIREMSSRLAKWWGLLITSIILLVASAQFHYSQNCVSGGATTLSQDACESNKFAVSLGAFGTLLTLVTIILAHAGILPFIIETIVTLLMFMLYTAGISDITYNHGSGTSVGNIFFSTWAGFLLSFLLCLDCYHVYMKQRAKRRADSPPAEKKRFLCCSWGDSDSEDSDNHEQEPSPRKKTPKKASNPRKGQTSQFQSAPQQPIPVTRKISMRSSIDDDDEFADARDDLDLKL
jgi:hypothetical protein